MVRGGVECILGVHRDPALGAMVMLGAGGVHVELLRDVVFRVTPVTLEEARDMIGELKTAALLHGFRGGAPRSEAPPCEGAHHRVAGCEGGIREVAVVVDRGAAGSGQLTYDDRPIEVSPA